VGFVKVDCNGGTRNKMADTAVLQIAG